MSHHPLRTNKCDQQQRGNRVARASCHQTESRTREHRRVAVVRVVSPSFRAMVGRWSTVSQHARTPWPSLSLSLTLRCVELSVEEDAGITDLPKTHRDHLNEGTRQRMKE